MSDEGQSANDENRCWKVIQRRGNGEIASVLRDLTREEAEFIKARIEGQPATAEEKRAAELFANEQNERWHAWLRERGLDPMRTSCGGTSGPSFIMRNGFPMRGQEHSPHMNSGWRSYSPSDVISAEIFR